MSRHAHDSATAFLVAATGIALFSVMDATMKGLVIAIGTFATLFWRSLVSVLFSSALYLPRRKGWPERHILRIHLARGAVGTVMAVLFFWGLARVPLAQGIALSFVAPLIALYLAAAVLCEEVGRQIIVASIIGFAGVLVIVAGQAHADLGPSALVGSAAILAAALCYAVNIIMMRQQSMVAGPVEIGFFQNGTIVLLLLAALPFLGTVLPPANVWPFILLAAFLSTSSMMVLAWAYARARASYLANTEYTAFLWASLFGWLIFHEPVGPFTLAGAALIITGCILATQKKRVAAPGLEAAA
jgi:S-adenosylmethionine uptake transporter